MFFVIKFLMIISFFILHIRAESSVTTEELQPRNSIVHINLMMNDEEPSPYLIGSHALGTLIAPDLVLTTTKISKGLPLNRTYKISFNHIKNDEQQNAQVLGTVVYSNLNFAIIKLDQTVEQIFNYSIKPVYFALEDSLGNRLRWKNKIDFDRAEQPSINSCLRQGYESQEESESQSSMFSNYIGLMWLVGPAIVYDLISSGLSSSKNSRLTPDQLCTAEFEKVYTAEKKSGKKPQQIGLNFRKCLISRDQTMLKIEGLNLDNCGARVLGTLGRPYFFQDEENGEFVIVGLQYDLSDFDKSLSDVYGQDSRVVGRDMYPAESINIPIYGKIMDPLFNDEVKDLLKVRN